MGHDWQLTSRVDQSGKLGWKCATCGFWAPPSQFGFGNKPIPEVLSHQDATMKQLPVRGLSCDEAVAWQVHDE